MKTIIKTSVFVLLLILFQSCKEDNTTLPVITTAEVTNISYSTASLGGELIDDGGGSIRAQGVCWNTSPNPTISDNVSAQSFGLGSFTCEITSLLANTAYYVRAYATNSAGTAYGDEKRFITGPPVAPSLTTSEIFSLTVSSVSSGGAITSDGGAPITSCGLCWDSTKNPTITKNITTASLNGDSFISRINYLVPNSIYYIRAYATNSSGTSYGNELTVQTYAVTDIEGNGYHSITIGDQTWMKENLKVTKYNNGDPIGTTIPANKDISAEINPKYQWAYSADYGADSKANANVYGRLYTWYAVSDSRNMCPSGWHVGTESEWEDLIVWLEANGYYHDGASSPDLFNTLGISLADPLHWENSDIPGTIGNDDYPELRNKTGFSALPSGQRWLSGHYGNLGSSSLWWTATELLHDQSFAWVAKMTYDGTFIIINGHPKDTGGYSVRCVKD